MVNPLLATVLMDGKNIHGEQILGGNYQSRDNYFDTGISCLKIKKQDKEVIHNEEATVTATSSMDYDSLSREMGHKVEIGANLPFGDPLGLGFSFLRNVKETNTSIVFAYKTILKTGSLILKGPHKLSQEAKESADHSREEFLQYCGDQFVYKIEKGAKAFAAVKIELESEDLKRVIEQEFGLAIVDFFDISNQLKKLIKKYGIKGRVTISGYQEGGFAARINSIFGNGEGLGECSGTSFAKCEVLLKEVVHYFAHDFAEQFDQYYRDRNVLGGGSVVVLPPSSKTLSYHAQSYCKLAINDRPRGIDCSDIDNAAFLRDLSEKRTLMVQELTKIGRIFQGDAMVSKDHREKLGHYEKEIRLNLAFLDKAFKSCRRDQWSCQSTVVQVLKVLGPLNKRLMNSLQREQRFEICLQTGKMNQVKSFNMGIGRGGKMLKTFSIFNPLRKEGKECFKYYAPELSEVDFDQFFIQIKKKKEKGGQCKWRFSKKYKTWALWDLQKVEVTRLNDGKKRVFKGISFYEKTRCRQEEDPNDFLPWSSLEAQNE
jgi:hypothetical protein